MKKRTTRRILPVVLLILAALVLTAFIREERINGNVWALGVSLAGLPKDQAEKVLVGKMAEIQEGPLVFLAGARRYQVLPNEMTLVPDKSGVLARVRNYLSSEPRLLPSVFFRNGPKTVIPTLLGVVSSNVDQVFEKIARELSFPALGTRYGFEGHDLKILPPSEGQRVTPEDVRKALNALEGREVKVAYTVIPAPSESTPGGLPGSGSCGKLPNLSLLAEFTTEYDQSETDRVQNLILAAQAVHGKVIQPGQTYSFNKEAGERTEEKGYKYALVVVGDHLEPGLAGGICQVTTTLFNACAQAGLDFPEVHAHGIPVEYVPPGRDAAVAWGYLDIKIMNNRELPVVLGAWVENGKILVRVYGQPDGKTYDLEPVLVKEYPEEGKKPGLLVETYLVEKKNGEVKSRKLIMRSYYSPHLEHVK